MNNMKMYQGKNWIIISFFSSILRSVGLFHCTVLSSLLVVTIYGSDVISHSPISKLIILGVFTILKILLVNRTLKGSEDVFLKAVIFISIDVLGAILVFSTPIGFVASIIVLSVVLIAAVGFTYMMQNTMKQMKDNGMLDEVYANLGEVQENLIKNQENRIFKTYLMEKIKKELPNLKLDDVYAISLYVECYDLPNLYLSCNTEDEDNKEPISEERWNFAYWLQNTIDIIDSEDLESIEHLTTWLNRIGIKNPGEEDLSWDAAYDNGVYIGKGPNGVYEFVELLKEIVIELHKTGYIEEVFGKKIPIIIHDLEYVWYMLEATYQANPEELIRNFKEYYDTL